MSHDRPKQALATALILLASGCTSVPASISPSPDAESSASVVSTTLPEICDGTGTILVTRAWDRVVASVGAADHADMIDGLSEAVEAMEDRASEGCIGLDELEELSLETVVLRDGVAEDAAEDSLYAAVSEAGNAWLSAIEEDGQFGAAPSLPAKPSLTASQEQAIGKAQDYLDFTAFSKSGLVKQLVYEGFSKKDAQFAVDYLDVDWNEQAAQKAKDYLDFTSFSRKGLIKQLEFEGFTREQAEHGAKAAGL